MGKYQKNIEAARRISVMQYLETYHPGELVRKTDKEYCTKTHSSLVITPANGLFHWFSQSKGGNNALDYLVKVEGMDFVSAVRLLNEMTPMPVSVQTAKAAPVQQQTSRPFVLPLADRNTEAATAYLMHRGISPKVLRYCVGSGILYQTTRGNYRNCVFVGKDENGVPRSAFQRGCQGSFRGDVAGSQKQYGFLIPAESENCDTVEIYEAPIDAMSGATLRQYKHDSPWRSVHYLALGGLNHQPIDYFLQQHPEVKRVSLCFDRDDPGRNFTKIVAKQLAERGYIVQDAPPAMRSCRTCRTRKSTVCKASLTASMMPSAPSTALSTAAARSCLSGMTAATICCVHWKMSMKKETLSASRICSPKGLSALHRYPTTPTRHRTLWH